MMICSSQLPGKMSLGQKEKKKKKREMWQFYCSSVKLLCIAMMYVTAEGRSHQPGLEQHSEDHAVQGCQSIPMWLSMSEGAEQTHWKPLRKAVLGGRIKNTDVTIDVHR